MGETMETKRSSNPLLDRNPWYILSTICGIPDGSENDIALREKNAGVWNWYVERFLPSENIEEAIKEGVISSYVVSSISEADFKKIWKERLSVIGNTVNIGPPTIPKPNFAPVNAIDFENINFDRKVCFEDFLFPVNISFNNSEFEDDASFSGAVFLDIANFQYCKFKMETYFWECNFYKYALFIESEFVYPAEFSQAVFGHAMFDQSVFFEPANFSECKFKSDADFSGVKFKKEADFSKVPFRKSANFRNCEFSSTTWFDDAVFAEPPLFQGASMHPDTVWPTSNSAWPSKPSSPKEAGIAVRAWSSLKWSMSQVQNHDAELDFYARELDAKRIYISPPKKLVLFLYSHFSDYGRSALRALIWWIGTWLTVFSANCWLLLGQIPGDKFEHVVAVTDFTFGNAFSLGGTYTNPERREALATTVFENTDTGQIPWLIDLLSLGHSFASLLFLFLIGLALRNRLRIK